MENHVVFEDRTNESPERAMHRQLAAPAAALCGQALMMSKGNPAVATQLLAAALGQAVAGTGLAVDEVLAFFNQHVELARGLIEERRLAFSAHADA